MRCKKHPADLSSGIGVCASCLWERLIAAQLQQDSRRGDSHRPPPPPPPPLSFPRSVSPYISRRKSDIAANTWSQHSTPQVGPTWSVKVGVREGTKMSKGRGFSSMIRGLFRWRSDVDTGPIADAGIPSLDPCSNSPIPSRHRKALTAEGGSRRPTWKASWSRDQGISPARFSDDDDGSSGYSSESSRGWRQTPRRTPASARRGGGRPAVTASYASGLSFWLSPLVRASPSRWQLKGMPAEVAVPGESRVPPKTHHSGAAAFFYKNRSRKLADLGRYSHTRS